MCTRQARPTLSAVLEQLQDKALFAVDPSGSIVKELSCRRNSSCPLDARGQAFAPGLLLALWRSTFVSPSDNIQCRRHAYSAKRRFSLISRPPTSRSELYARRPQPLLAGWRDAAERTLLGKETANEEDGWSIYLSSLSDEQEEPGRVCIHQEGYLVRHNGRRPDQHMRCEYVHYRYMHMHTGGHIYMAGTTRTTRRSCRPLSLHRGLSSF